MLHMQIASIIQLYLAGDHFGGPGQRSVCFAQIPHDGRGSNGGGKQRVPTFMDTRARTTSRWGRQPQLRPCAILRGSCRIGRKTA